MSTDPAHRFDSLVDYLRHLVDDHGIAETKELWASGRDLFDSLHAGAHAPTFEDGLSAGWARAVEALTEEHVSSRVRWVFHEQHDVDGVDPEVPERADECTICSEAADSVLAAAARALTESQP